MASRLATCSWRAYRPEMWLAVRITLGKPPHWFTYPYEEVRLLALPPRVFRFRDDRAFKGAYERHLEAVGWSPTAEVPGPLRAPRRPLYARLSVYRSRVGLSLCPPTSLWPSEAILAARPLQPPLTLRALLPTGKYGASHDSARR
jgi:hypothetical protein